MYIRLFRRTKRNSGTASISGLTILAGVSIVIFGILLTVYLVSSRKHTSNVDYGESKRETFSGTEQSGAVKRDPTLYWIDDDFYVRYIEDDIFSRINGKSFNDLTPVTVEELRYIHILHNGTDGNSHEGELIVHMTIAEDILDIFYELYEIGYVIEQVSLVDDYGADDNASMLVNNTSSFNSRYISGSDILSWHAYGLAVDINPLYNPYVLDEDICLPASARRYMDRTLDFDMKIDMNDMCCRIFLKHGFTWGGAWDNPKDYMHFEKVADEFLNK